MSKFVIISVPTEQKAFQAVDALNEMHDDGTVTLYSYAMVQRSADGTIAVKEKYREGPLGTGVAALVGGLMGLLGGPAGAAIGFGAGTAVGALADLFGLGLGNDFLDRATRELAPGKIAIVAEVSEEWGTPLDTRVEALGGSVIRETRVDFIDDQIEKRMNEYKAEVDERRKEHAAAKVERMEARLANEIARSEEKLRTELDTARRRLESERLEAKARIERLREQASKASPQVRERIERRIFALQNDGEKRIHKLEVAYDLSQRALHA
jgi:uncharacterized membrane protein